MVVGGAHLDTQASRRPETPAGNGGLGILRISPGPAYEGKCLVGLGPTWSVWVPPGLGINGPCVTIRARCPHCSRAVPWRPSSPGSSPVNTWPYLVAGETGWWCASARVGEPRESGVGRSHLGQHTAGGELLLTLRVPGLPVGPWATALPLLPSWASSWRLLWLQYCF